MQLKFSIALTVHLQQGPQKSKLCELLDSYNKGIPKLTSSASNFDKPEYLEALEGLKNLPQSWTDIVNYNGKLSTSLQGSNIGSEQEKKTPPFTPTYRNERNGDENSICYLGIGNYGSVLHPRPANSNRCKYSLMSMPFQVLFGEKRRRTSESKASDMLMVYIQFPGTC